MAIHSKSISIPATTLAASPVSSIFELGAAFIRRIHVLTPAAGLGVIGFRLTHQNMGFFPWIGLNCDAWFTPQATYMYFDEFRKISGPGYQIGYEAYNTSGAIVVLQLVIEAAQDNYLPVSVMRVPPVQSGTPTTESGGY